MASSQKLTAFTNKDKENHTVGGMLPGFPSRVGYFAAPSRGKRSACLNLLAREKPMFDTFTVVHIDPNTTEYSLLDDGDYKVIGFHQDGLPDPTSFDRSKKNCLILDELPFDSFSVAQKSQLERLMNFGSTHHSISIHIQAQDVFAVPISVRRALTHVALWSSPIRMSQALYSRMLGLKLQPLFDKLCTSRYDFLFLDFTGDGPPVRKNVFEVIDAYERSG